MRIVHGVAINDAEYAVQVRREVDGKRKLVFCCPYYTRWENMLKRALSDKTKAKHPTYSDCTVCEDWLLFSNFKKWMETQDWEGNHLDKDILDVGNKEYCPEKCVFVHPTVNVFLTDRGNHRGEFKLGVVWYKRYNKFRASCSNPFTKKYETLGYFETENEAHLAWKKRKHELACKLAESEYVTDERVAEALRTRYSDLDTQPKAS